MGNNPKRRKSMDNPYTIDNKNNDYNVSFKDVKNKTKVVKITKEVYEAFDNFELEDISQMHRYERHIEHSEMLDEQVYTRAFNKPKSVEEQVENNIFNEQLKDAIHSLNNVQKRRIIKYFFEDKTLEEIADEEKCSKVAIKYSIDNALEKISKKFKN